MVETIILQCKSGFSNRMLPLLSCYSYCKSNNISLVVIWVDNTCRSCLPIEHDTYLALDHYYDIIPERVNSYRTLDDYIKHSGINKHNIYLS